eukprot:GHVR01033439.1.p1 GENE.GHVR01033439.1~~GHVR01033439.1.p1  ORF type:complete len:137 (-),score=2.39 GHVR01033439.1:332-742(-)
MVNLDLLFQGHKYQLKILTFSAAGALGPSGLFILLLLYFYGKSSVIIVCIKNMHVFTHPSATSATRPCTSLIIYILLLFAVQADQREERELAMQRPNIPAPLIVTFQNIHQNGPPLANLHVPSTLLINAQSFPIEQ